MKNTCETCGKAKYYLVFDAKNNKVRFFCLRHLAEFTGIPMMELSKTVIMPDKTAHLDDPNDIPILYVERLPNHEEHK